MSRRSRCCAARTLLASEIASQIAIHQEYGGVVPEVASRNHLRVLRPLVEATLDKAGVALPEVDVFAATQGPGLATSLMIGACLAKGHGRRRGQGFRRGEPHGRPSPFAVFSRSPAACGRRVALIVSGGHTMLVEIKKRGDYRLLGRTQDDAAGEAFDKVGKLLGLPYPGGPNIDRLAREGNPRAHAFPRSMLDSRDFDFSFSGLKTAVRYLLPKLESPSLPDLCASFQEAVVDVLVTKTLRAARETGQRVVAISGGVSCNSGLRARFQRECAAAGTGVADGRPVALHRQRRDDRLRRCACATRREKPRR